MRKIVHGSFFAYAKETRSVLISMTDNKKRRMPRGIKVNPVQWISPSDMVETQRTSQD